ncbi:MAG: restriction endonuclease subunit S [Myxococcales bacterium]|nr:restriction endonuclease subunit S [Myxococcales bacterium]
MSFPRYAKYKPSGVGWLGDVPAHWDVRELRQLGRLMKGSGGSKEDIVDSGVPCVRYGDLYTTHSFFVETARTCLTSERAAAYTPIKYGDILFAASGEKLDEIGKAAVNLILGEAVCGGDLILLRPSASVWPRFMGYASDSAPSALQKASMGRGTTVKHIYPDELRHLVLTLPPEVEQQVIAAFLDRETAKIDALVAEQERLIELLNEKRQAVISHVVTKGLNPNAPMKDSGIEWLGKIPAHWSVPPVYARYNQALGKMLDEGKMTGEHPTPYLRNVDVRWDRFNIEDLPVMDIRPDEAERFMVRKGDLLMVEGRELGRSAIWDGADHIVAFQKALHRLRPLDDTEHPRFFYYTMVFANGVGVFFADQSPNEIPHLTGEQLRQHRFPKPPISEQISIVEALDQRTRAIDALTVECERATTLLQERRAALISAAVTGQIDVRPESVRAAA